MSTLRKNNSVSENPYELCARAKAQFGIAKVALAFSAGKDSIAAWLALRHAQIEVIPIHFMVHPDLQIIEDTLKFYEDHFQTKIIRLIHPCFWDIFKNLLFVNPYMVRLIEDINLYEHPSFEAQTNGFLRSIGEPDMWQAKGIKRADSLIRMMAINKGSPINQNSKTVYPMANYGDKQAFSMLIRHKVPLPSYYHLLGESLDIMKNYVVEYLRDNYPLDYERLKSIQPLIDLEHIRTRLG
jgi:hypothetical protein